MAPLKAVVLRNLHWMIDPELAVAHIRRSILRRIQDAGYPSIERFAFEHGLTKQTISRAINGSRNTRLITLFQIANALEIQIDELMDVQGMGKIKPPKAPAKLAKTKRIKVV